jgi:hypothetical protein
MSTAEKQSAQARVQICEDAADLLEEVKLLEDVITRKADRDRVAKSLEYTARRLGLAAARFSKSPKAAEVLRTLQTKHPGTNHN